MNPYTLEMLARERQRDILQDADRRRQVALARAQLAERGRSAPRFGAITRLANALRALAVPGRKARIERTSLGDAS